MKVYAKILGVVLVALAIELALAAGGKGAGDTLVSRAFTVASNINSLVSRAFTVSSNTDSLVSRAFTVTTNVNSLVSRAFTVSSNTDSLVSRAFTVSSNIDSLVSRAFTVVVNCDDGLDGLCPDCDNDGMPDGCELDCGPPGGPCSEFPDCGMSEDCDGNGVPDECQLPESCEDGICTVNCDDCNGNCMVDACDIANCEDDLACNDCNLNGIPDICDDPEDSIPDECIVWVEKPLDELWSTDGNWEGDDAPGNGMPEDDQESVVIAAAEANVVLDIDVSIDSLLLGAGATLHIDRDGELGDMIVESGGAILVEGNLLVAHDREIDASDASVTIGPGGMYQADAEAAGAISATLIAGSVTVLEGPAADGGGGVMSLTDGMQLVVEGNLTLEGLNAGGGLASGGDGDCTPPDWNTHDNAFVSVAGDIDMSGGVASEHASSEPLILGGDFNNRSIGTQIFDWSAGALTMDGTLQTIEAAGKDHGTCPMGLVNNFAFGILTIKAGTTVRVVNTFDNQQDGVVACDEALYVDLLEVPEGATLLTDGCHVYYNTLVDGGSLSDVDVLQIVVRAADLNGDGQVGPVDLATLLGAWGPCGDCDNCPPDLDGDCEVGPIDLAQLLGDWGGCPL